MKHFFNRRETIVTEALDGLLRTTPAGMLARLDSYPDIKVIVRADWDKSRVAVISGGGAGHEPSHAGFVGKGMLTAAVSGEIFASPSVDAVLTAIRAVTGQPGCLLVVKNYTGDRLNFGLAVEKARAEGFAVDMVIVADDIALPDISQPRGVAGTLFVHKIAGHLAEAGKDLATVAAAAKAAATDIRSLGVSYSSCSLPGQPHEERLSETQGELGLGIHGEPGIEKIEVQTVDSVISLMTARLSSTMTSEARYALLINNLGAVPPVEMAVIADSILSSPFAERIALTIGPAPLMTALNMNGFSLSLIRLDAEREAALLAQVAPTAWVPAVVSHGVAVIPAPKAAAAFTAAPASRDAVAEAVLEAICERLILLEAELNRLDARAGDGDTGSTAATGARSILAQRGALPFADRAGLFAAIGETLATSMGGSSGVLLSIFFTAAGKAMGDGADLAASLLSGLERMTFYGGAHPGDRTMVDALSPALHALAAEGVGVAAAAARRGAEATMRMRKAKAGRSAYIGETDLDGVMDPGAHAVAEVFAAAASV